MEIEVPVQSKPSSNIKLKLSGTLSTLLPSELVQLPVQSSTPNIDMEAVNYLIHIVDSGDDRENLVWVDQRDINYITYHHGSDREGIREPTVTHKQRNWESIN